MGKKVLFVDDEADWLFMVANYLKEYGYETLTAKSGSEALHLSNGIELDVIILDVNLVGENGVTLMAFLKRNHPGVPIILYTGMRHDDAAIEAMMKQGAYKYLLKGTLENLLKNVQNAPKVVRPDKGTKL